MADSVCCPFYDGSEGDIQYVRPGSNKESHRGWDIWQYPRDISVVHKVRFPYKFKTEFVGDAASLGGTSWTWGIIVKGLILEGPYTGYSFLAAHLNNTYVALGVTYPAGTAVGNEGWTGNTEPSGSGGRHLHIELLKGWTRADISPIMGIPREPTRTRYVNTYRVGQDIVDPVVTLPMDGIDVSAHQGDIDFKKVAAAGKRFVMLRAGTWSGNSIATDKYFEKNYAGAKEAGLLVGAYFYSYSYTLDSIMNEARFFVDLLKGKQFEMPVCMDYEYEPKILALSNAERTRNVKAFLEHLEENGFYAALYASTDFINNKLNYSELASYDMWSAQYGSKNTCKLPYGIWQTHGSPQKNWPGGTCDGVNGWVDLDIAYKDYATIMKKAGLNGFNGDEPIPEPVTSSVMLLRSFGGANMQGFSSPNANGAVPYDHMPNAYRVVTETGLIGEDEYSRQWPWVALVDERNNQIIYTPVIADRNELITDQQFLLPEEIVNQLGS